MSIDIRLNKAQISKIIQSGEFLGKTLGKLSKEYCQTLLFLWIKMFRLNQQLKQLLLYQINLRKKITGQVVVRAGKGFILFDSNEDMDINKIVEL